MKNRLVIALMIVTMPVLFFISCSKSGADQPPVVTPPPGGGGTTNTTCDTADMKYTANVVPIMQAHCYSCHGGNNTGGGGGISLDSYNNLKTYADNGILVGNISHAAGFVGMPFGQPKMDNCTINKIIDWVNRGALNN